MDHSYLTVTVWLSIFVVNAIENEKITSTLTTMTTRAPVWPKPSSPLQQFSEKNTKSEQKNTTEVTAEEKWIPEKKEISLRRAILEKNDSLKLNIVSEIRGHEGRRSGDNFQWGWDKWCQLQPKVGDCRGQQTFFYYQAQTDTCREFVYTGCNGNENRFTIRTDCERFCKGFGTVMETRSLSQVEICSLQPDPGNCLSFIKKYYYEVNNGRCKEFVFGGCGGNLNRFPDRQTCMHKCDGVFLRHRPRA